MYISIGKKMHFYILLTQKIVWQLLDSVEKLEFVCRPVFSSYRNLSCWPPLTWDKLDFFIFLMCFYKILKNISSKKHYLMFLGKLCFVVVAVVVTLKSTFLLNHTITFQRKWRKKLSNVIKKLKWTNVVTFI